jgi:hypothetical protein
MYRQKIVFTEDFEGMDKHYLVNFGATQFF